MWESATGKKPRKKRRGRTGGVGGNDDDELEDVLSPFELDCTPPYRISGVLKIEYGKKGRGNAPSSPSCNNETVRSKHTPLSYGLASFHPMSYRPTNLTVKCRRVLGFLNATENAEKTRKETENQFSPPMRARERKTERTGATTSHSP
jgi:hypothetical protein